MDKITNGDEGTTNKLVVIEDKKKFNCKWQWILLTSLFIFV